MYKRQLVPTYLVAVLGNMLPVPIILLFAKRVLLWCTTWPGALGRFFTKIYEKGVKAGDKMQEKAGRGIYWALYLFVAVPLPGTGEMCIRDSRGAALCVFKDAEIFQCPRWNPESEPARRSGTHGPRRACLLYTSRCV